MKRKAVKILITSIVSITVWDLLRQLDLLSVNSSRILWAVSILFFLFASISLLKDFKFEDNYFKYILVLFLIYQLITIVRGFFLSTNGIMQIFREPQNFFGFIIPIFVFFDKKSFNIVNLLKILYGLGILFLILTICFPNLLLMRLYAETFISTFATGCGFLLMNATYLSNRRVNISFIVILLSALSLTYLARRSGAFTLFGFLFLSYLINILNKSNKKVFKLFPLIIGIGFFLLLFPNKFSSALTEKMKERLYDDSRTELFDAFFIKMNDYKVFGKGMNGTYLYSMEESELDDGIVFSEVEYRNVIENGYLQLYLAGGLISVTLFILLLLPAAFLGIFRSHNQFSRACGLMIFLWLLDMLFFGLPIFSIHYVIIWICVGMCYKKSLRNRTDIQIRNEFTKYSLN